MKRLLYVSPIVFWAFLPLAVPAQSTPGIDASSVKARQMTTRSWNTGTISMGDSEEAAERRARQVARERAASAVKAVQKTEAELSPLTKFARSKKMNEKALIAVLIEPGCELSDAVLLLGDPNTQEIDKFADANVVKCRWFLGNDKMLYVGFRDGRATHVSPEGFSVTEYASYRSAALDFLQQSEADQAEFERLAELDRKNAEADKRKAFIAKRDKEHLAEVAEVREWSLANGKIHKGLLVGVDKNFILLEDKDLPEGKQRRKIEALTLSKDDRNRVKLYCLDKGVALPNLDPSTRIKKGMSKKVVENILGPPVFHYYWIIDDNNAFRIQWEGVGNPARDPSGRTSIYYYPSYKVADIDFRKAYSPNGIEHDIGTYEMKLRNYYSNKADMPYDNGSSFPEWE